MNIDSDLQNAVRAMVRDPSADIVRWRARALGEGFADAMSGGEGLILHRGIVRTARGEQEFELVEKICRVLPGGQEPGSWLYWKREAMAYQSGFLDACAAGLTAPKCFGVVYTSEPSARVFMEAISDKQPDWTRETYARAAVALGEFNGSRLDMTDVDRHGWMAIGRAHSWTEIAAGTLNDLGGQSDDPVLTRWLRGSSHRRTVDLWRNIGQLRSALAELQRCFCHHDAFRRNLLFRSTGDTDEEIVAIDWAFAGHGVIGEELAAFVGASLMFMEFGPAEARDMIGLAFSNYLIGLKKSGWTGSKNDARLGFCATTAMMFGLGALGPWLPLLRDPDFAPVVEGIVGVDPDRFIQNLADIHPIFLDLGEEAVEVAGL